MSEEKEKSLLDSDVKIKHIVYFIGLLFIGYTLFIGGSEYYSAITNSTTINNQLKQARTDNKNLQSIIDSLTMDNVNIIDVINEQDKLINIANELIKQDSLKEGQIVGDINELRKKYQNAKNKSIDIGDNDKLKFIRSELYK